jgi:oligosaccharide 4-alpha-D-glucosyltransferase
MKKIFLLSFLGILSVGFGQNSNRIFEKLIKNKENFEIKVSDGTYFLSFVNHQIIETSFVPKGEKFITNSHAKVAQNINFNYKSVLENQKTITAKHQNLEIRITKKPFQIAYFLNNKEIISEKNGYFKKKHIPLENVKGNILQDSTHAFQFNITSSEVLYGAGARALGMNRRGNRLALYNKAHYGYETKSELMNFCIPLVLSSNIYSVHFDNPTIGYLDLDAQKNNTLEYECISGKKTYQVIIGNTWENLIENYVHLTGKQPLPPQWTFGNFSSRFGYHTQEEVEKTIQKFQEEQIPVDAIILDLYWFGKTIKGTMGNLDWDKENFPEPEKMIADLNKKGVKTVLITEPFILTTSSKWQETVDKKVLATLNPEVSGGKPATWDFYFGNTGIVDVFKPEGASWFWNVYKRLINQGVAGLWGDLGEPEVFPSFANTFAGTADEVHNIYGHQWAKLIQDGYQKEFKNQRPFILMRSGYSGSQRFGMIPWSGDVNRSWGGLQSQMEIALQMGMQGMAYMHSDLGGFAGDYYDNELYLRWLQFGVFNPVFRPHAQEEVASEVVYKDIDTKKIAKKAVELRYQLLPYNYNLAFENSQTGEPLMRPLFFEEPQNKNLLSKSDGYLWGNDFLIYPVTERGQNTKEIYFPKSSNWFDFYTNKKHAAGTTETIALNKNYIPTFVRGGSFIPMIKTIQNTSEYQLNDFVVHYFYDEDVKNSNLKLYNDDGKTTNNFENSLFELVELNSNYSNQTLTIKVNLIKEFREKSFKKIKLIINEYNRFSTIFVNKKELKNDEYQLKNNVLTIEIDVSLNNAKEIVIKH